VRDACPAHRIKTAPRDARETKGQRMNRPAIIPRIITDHYAEAAEFMRRVLGGTGETQHGMPTEIRIGDSIVMISDGGGARAPMPAFLYVHVPDVDAAFLRAVELGVEVQEVPTAQFYGDRRATVRDPWGNVWQIATPVKEKTDGKT
jgi:PhnB protein